MGMWKYKYLPQDTTEIREGYLDIEDDDDRLAVVEKIQELRIALNAKGCQFIEAGPVNGAEKAISAKLEKLKQFKKPRRLKPKQFKKPRRLKPKPRSSYWPVLLCLLLLALLVLLASL